MIKAMLYGVISSLTFTSPPLYRYPYRSAGEAFRSDWKRIGGDMEAARFVTSGADAEGDEE